jgi:hypothetical protein
VAEAVVEEEQELEVVVEVTAGVATLYGIRPQSFSTLCTV